MADLPYIDATMEVKIAGQDSVGSNVNFVGADVNGNMLAKDYSDGPVGAGTAASSSSLIGAIFNSVLPTLTNGQQAALQADSSGRLLIGSIASALPAGANNIGSVNQGTSPWIVAGGGTAGASGTAVLTVQGIAGGTAIPISGTVTATNPSVSATGSAPPASATYIGGSVTTAAPAYTTGQMNALSLTTTGLLRVDGSGVTQPVSQSGAWTVSATQNGTWTVQQGTAPWSFVGNLINNNAAPVATNIGALTALAEGTLNAARYTTGEQVLLVTDLAGNTNVDLQYYLGAAVSKTNPVATTISDGTNVITAAISAYGTAPTGTEVMGVNAYITNVPAVNQGTSPWIVKDLADGSAAGGTTGTFSQLAGGIYNSTPPILTTGQQASLQLDSSGRLLVDIQELPVDIVVSGTLTTLGQTLVATTTGGQATWSVDLRGNGSGWTVGTNIVFEYSVDGTNWLPAYGVQLDAINTEPNDGASGPNPISFQGSMAGCLLFRVRVFAYNGPDQVVASIRLSVATSVVSIRNALPVGSNVIGGVTQSGGPWTSNITQIGGTVLTLGQELMAASIPVALASNQSGINTFLDKNQTGTITALNGNVAVATNGMSSVIVTVTGTWSATLTFEGFDGTNWIVTAGLTQPAGGITESIIANGTVLINSGGYSQIRIIATSYASGTANIFMNAGAGVALIEVYNDSQNPLIIAGQGSAGTPATEVVTIQGITGGTNLPVGQTTAANLNAQIVGNVASGTTDSGNGVKIASVSNVNIASLPTTADGQRVDAQSDLQGRIYVTNAPTDGAKPTYSLAATVTTAAAATDVVTIVGSATKTIRVILVRVTGIATTAITTPVLLIKRSTANTGGTSTAPTAVSHDSSNPAATATGLAYTANPTVGATVGTLRQDRLTFATTATVAEGPIEWTLGNKPGQALVLRGTTQVLAVNLNGVTITGGSLSVDIEWTEE